MFQEQKINRKEKKISVEGPSWISWNGSVPSLSDVYNMDDLN
jgi:hypothetical protein